MNNKTLLPHIAIIVLFCVSSSFALDTLGPPVAQLGQGQFSVGADYSYSNMDLTAKGRSIFTIDSTMWDGSIRYIYNTESLRLNGVDVQKIYTNFGYGITDNWEAFLRLGGANAELKDDRDTNFALGFGSRLTLYKADRLQVGAIAQFSWARFNYDTVPLTSDFSGQVSSTTSGRLSLQEIQIAIGPTYQFTKDIAIYGGPFFRFVDGELDLKGKPRVSWISIPEIFYPQIRYLYDIDEISELGGYIGTRIDIAENISYSIEYQHTTAADALGMGLIWKF